MIHHQDIGAWLWSETYRHTESDMQALQRFMVYVRDLPDSDPRKRDLMDRSQVPSARHDMLMSALWTHCASPVIRISHRWAAAAICTSLPEDLELHAPWRSFMILVPDRLLPVIEPETQRELWVSHALVERRTTEHGPVWTVLGMCADSHMQCGTRGVTTHQLLGEFRGTADDSALMWPIDSQTDRTIQCLRQLACNVMVTMMGDADSCRAIGKHLANWTRGPRRDADGPAHRMFQVGRPVSIDVRDAVREYCRGGLRSTPTVASLVRGHYRRVPCGERRSQRRLQWIQPFWRGPVEGAITSPRVKVGD